MTEVAFDMVMADDRSTVTIGGMGTATDVEATTEFVVLGTICVSSNVEAAEEPTLPFKFPPMEAGAVINFNASVWSFAWPRA